MDTKKNIKTLWGEPRKATLTMMLCEAVQSSAKSLDIGCYLPKQWESQEAGRERTMVLLGAFSLAGEEVLSKAASAALADLTLVGGGGFYAGGYPGRDAGVAWAVAVLSQARLPNIKGLLPKNLSGPRLVDGQIH